MDPEFDSVCATTLEKSERTESLRKRIRTEFLQIFLAVIPSAPISTCRERRTPSSRSAWRTHLRSVSAEHPIFDDTEPMAAHCDSCAPWWSRTNRTARSRSSGEYLFECFMAPVSQGLEPPGNPGQFNLANQFVVGQFWEQAAQN